MSIGGHCRSTVNHAIFVYFLSVDRNHPSIDQFGNGISSAAAPIHCLASWVSFAERFIIKGLRENSSIHRVGGEKERLLAKSQAPPLELNQFVPYLTGSPPSRQECRYRQESRCPHYKTIYTNIPWRFSAAAL